MNRTRVYLVGAGCGDADLITRRGAKLIAGCDVLIHDDLTAPGLLDMAPAHAEIIYMGKRSGQHAAAQSEINAKLVEKALEGKMVVRLKGGDPFVFGRGGEEAEALRAAGIDFELVPGISSAIAIPELAGIPVTHRGMSRSFHVITAHTADTGDGLPENMDKLAALPGTLVFLMGLSRLELLAEKLMRGGMNAGTPAAVISGGNSPNPAVVRGCLSDIAEKTRRAGVRSPAVIVVGSTAALDLCPAHDRPLRALKIALTGTDSMTGQLFPVLRELGAEVFAAQRSRVRELNEDFDMNSLFEGPATLVFTSSNGVRSFFRRLHEQKLDLRRLHLLRFAVIGASTGRLLASYGIQADYCPDEYTSEALGELLLSELQEGDRVYLFRSAMGSRPLYEALSKKLDVRDIHAYTVESDKAVSAAAAGKLPETDYILFSSAAGTELYFAGHGKIPEKAKCVCIGAVTAAALEARGITDYILADEISAEGLVKAVLKHRGEGEC